MNSLFVVSKMEDDFILVTVSILLFIIKSNKKTKYKTLTGECVEEIQPGTVQKSREFYKKYEQVDGFEVYGMKNISINTFQKIIRKMKSSLIQNRLS